MCSKAKPEAYLFLMFHYLFLLRQSGTLFMAILGHLAVPSERNSMEQDPIQQTLREGVLIFRAWAPVLATRKKQPAVAHG